MVENLPLKTLSHAGLTIEGYSRAAVQTYWRIPELKLGFDIGAQPWDFMGTPNWFISHTHMDHIAALPVYLARRRMMKMEPPTIYLPGRAIAPLNDMLTAFTRLDRGKLPCKFVAVQPGDEIELNREYVVQIGESEHTVPALSFLVWHRKNKLKEEFQGISGTEIRNLRQDGIEVSAEQRIPILGYTGDTTVAGLDNMPELLQAKILITEMTFVAANHSKEKIKKNGHMHLNDFIEQQDRFENEVVIAAHFSTRYSDSFIRRTVEKALPGLLDGRLHLWL
ncbi:MAG: MBL fold metallo-hydrolase [Planctomycetota bacterium]|nr:MBL fold metallo-hydrolase [Planctomycetota bacterium]